MVSCYLGGTKVRKRTLRNSESVNIRNCKIAEQRKCGTAKPPKYETAKVGDCGSVRLRKKLKYRSAKMVVFETAEVRNRENAKQRQ